MSLAIPIGERESQHLEFKAARALAQPETIARAVVAMLNADGGEVWVGLREVDGVARELEGIANPEDACRRLLDSLIDTIEPSPRGGELKVETGGTAVKALRIKVHPVAQRRPYGVVSSGGGRRYVVRVASRVRPLTREELRHFFGEQRGERVAGEDEEGTGVLERELKGALEATQPTLWQAMEPRVSNGHLDLDRLEGGDYLTRPKRTGNRQIGRTFYVARRRAELDGTPYLERGLGADGRSWLSASGGPYKLSFNDRGAVRAWAPLDDFRFLGEEPDPRLAALRGGEVLDPRGVSEYPVSVIRLLSALLQDSDLWPEGLPEGWWATLALIGVEGWYLRPDPEHPYFRFPPAIRLRPPEARWEPHAGPTDPLVAGPLVFSGQDLKEEPDYCAFRLLGRVFDAFGYSEGEILAYDRAARRFVF